MSSLEHTIQVSYPHRIHFTRNAFAPSNPLLRTLLGTGAPTLTPIRTLVVLDAGLVHARPELPEQVNAYFSASPDQGPHLTSPALTLAGGEASKTDWDATRQLLAALHQNRIDRHGYVLAVGGGAFLDMAGFATAIAHRGCRHVRLPSTTMAQADSGVGVKNGLNLFGKKNFVGTFAPPWAVVNDSAFLNTLHPRDRRGGLAEAVKVSLIRDAAFFYWLEQNADALAAFESAPLELAIERSALLHARHIATGGDPFELGSARPLDFGHWAAHKLEQLSGFTLRHGDAVAIGVALDSLYSVRQGWLDTASAERVLGLLRRLGFELFTPELRHPALLDGIEEFREHLGGQLTLTFLRGIGHGFEAHDHDPAQLPPCLDQLWGRT